MLAAAAYYLSWTPVQPANHGGRMWPPSPNIVDFIAVSVVDGGHATQVHVLLVSVDVQSDRTIR